MDKGISVVIPNYNGTGLFDQVLPPLFIALDNAGLSYEVIVSDDCSTDDSVAYLLQHYPSIKVLTAAINRGFSPTINTGIFATSYAYVLLLNSDVQLTPNYFNGLLRYFDREDTFGVMGKIIGWDDDQVQDGGKYPSYHGVKIKTSGNYLPTGDTGGETWLYSMYLSGANAFVSREKLIQLGGFDELFAPFYVEDFELSLRAWRLGWKCYFDPNSVCRHQVSVSIRSRARKNEIKAIYYRNKMFLHALHLPPAQLTMWYLQQIIEIFIHLVTGRMYYFKSLRMFLNAKAQLAASKKRLLELSEDEGVLHSVRSVTNTIIDSLKGIPIKRF